ncbi:MAG: hypothetical protein Q8K18_19410 [Burkholderiales bacterium]|nr:hypothetical protein [Burkholderiales bacterium]
MIVDTPDRGRLRLIDGKPLLALALVSCGLCFHCLKAEHGPRAVEVTLPGVLLHGTQGVLAVLLALVFIEQAEYLARHLAGRVVAGLLRDRLDLDAGTLERALIIQELEQIAKEARAAMHDDRLKRWRVLGGVRDHLLKHRALVIGGRRTRLDVFHSHQQAVRLAPCPHLRELVRDG